MLLDPTDTERLAGALIALLDAPEQRRRQRAAGLARAALFSWERAARETLEVYESVVRVEPSRIGR
jgi:glycosyltransferase involved in cell wall biosynthesis